MAKKKVNFKNRNFLTVFVVIFVVVALALIYSVKIFNQKVNPYPTSTAQATPIPYVDMSNWKTYTDFNNNYSFKYPSDWSYVIQKSIIGDNVPQVVFSFTVKGVKYYMIIANGGKEGPDVDRVVQENVTYDGIKFSKRTGIKSNKPFFIVLNPLDFSQVKNGHYLFSDIEINIPQDNPGMYVNIFNQILSSFKFNI